MTTPLQVLAAVRYSDLPRPRRDRTAGSGGQARNVAAGPPGAVLAGVAGDRP